MSAGAAPVRETFPPEILAAFFAAVEINDVVDPQVALPDPIRLDCSAEEMGRCFALCLQFWREGVARDDLLKLVRSLVRTRDLDPAERLRFKHIRARYKQLRFALQLYGARHEVPFVFGITVVIMGHVQDACRHRRRLTVLGLALLLRLLLVRPVWAWFRRRIGRARLDGADAFLAWRKAEVRAIAAALAEPELSGGQFHALRKIVSRQVSFYDSRRCLAPNDHDGKMSRYLSAINGLMGRRHDDMVEAATAGQRDYATKAPLDTDIRQRLETFVARYPH